jgi:hypothetical protein
MPECRIKVSLTFALLLAVNFFSPASAFRHQGHGLVQLTVYVFSRMVLNRLGYDIQRNNYWMVKDIWRIFSENTYRD